MQLLLVCVPCLLSNSKGNAHRKELKYHLLLTDPTKDCNKIKPVNPCIGSFGTFFEKSSDSLLKICIERGFDSRDLMFSLSILSTIMINATCCIFCMWNKSWC